jgi:hypothetical protein
MFMPCVAGFLDLLPFFGQHSHFSVPNRHVSQRVTEGSGPAGPAGLHALVRPTHLAIWSCSMWVSASK